MLFGESTPGRLRTAVFAASLPAAALAIAGCGASRAQLDRLATAGLIQEDAPVTAHVHLLVQAPPAKVWALLADVPSWPKWQRSIVQVDVAGPIRAGTAFSWQTGGTTIHSRVQLFEPERRLAWTGTALTAKAIHCWELTPEPGNATLVSVKESMDGPLMARLYPSDKLAEADMAWLNDLKLAAGHGSPR